MKLNAKETHNKFTDNENEVVFITNQGTFIINYNEFDEWYENSSVSYGEEGRSFEVCMAITPFGFITSHIWGYFTRTDKDY